jgi:hypothetical protein
MKKKNLKEIDYQKTDPNVSQQEAQAYSEYVAIKKAERKAEMKKEKIAERLVDSRAGGFVNNFSNGMTGYAAESADYGEEVPVLDEAPPHVAPEGVKALRGTTLPKVKKKNYSNRVKPGQYYLEPSSVPYLEPSAKIEVDYDREILPDLESVDAKLPSEIEMFSQVREDIRIFRTGDRTMISAVIVDKQEDNNRAVSIRCYGGIAFGGYVRDCSGDAYLIECIDYVHLGAIPFSLRIEIPKAGNWGVNIPIPEKVLMSSFAPSQLKAISDLKEKYPEDKFDINYLQMLLAN